MLDDEARKITHGVRHLLCGERVWIYPFGDHLNGYAFGVMREWGQGPVIGKCYPTPELAAQSFIRFFRPFVGGSEC